MSVAFYHPPDFMTAWNEAKDVPVNLKTQESYKLIDISLDIYLGLHGFTQALLFPAIN